MSQARAMKDTPDMPTAAVAESPKDQRAVAFEMPQLTHQRMKPISQPLQSPPAISTIGSVSTPTIKPMPERSALRTGVGS